GSLVSFPVAIAAGLTPIVANATNAVGLTPAALASAWGYRRELMSRDTAPPPLTVVRWMLIPMVLGGIVGALLLLWTPQRVFRHIVPLLVFAATALLFVQNVWASPIDDSPSAEGSRRPPRKALALGLAFAIAVYGGYFGAGMGILLLATLTLLAPGDIRRLNG